MRPPGTLHGSVVSLLPTDNLPMPFPESRWRSSRFPATPDHPRCHPPVPAACPLNAPVPCLCMERGAMPRVAAPDASAMLDSRHRQGCAPRDASSASDRAQRRSVTCPSNWRTSRSPATLRPSTTRQRYTSIGESTPLYRPSHASGRWVVSNNSRPHRSKIMKR